MAIRWKRILKYWNAADGFSHEEMDVTKIRVRLDDAILELLEDDGIVAARFGPGQSPYDCWLLELRSWAEE
jgi:hypothetical protein